MELNSKIYIAGHKGMVGSALLRNLEEKGYIPEGASKKKFLTKDELPKEFQENLKCYEAENIACLYKDKFYGLQSR